MDFKIGEEQFLTFLLKSYYLDNQSYFKNAINFNCIERAVNLFTLFFESEDKLTNSEHLKIIKIAFSDEIITEENCGEKLGISKKTFARYRQRYLQIFKNYLLQSVDAANCV